MKSEKFSNIFVFIFEILNCAECFAYNEALRGVI